MQLPWRRRASVEYPSLTYTKHGTQLNSPVELEIIHPSQNRRDCHEAASETKNFRKTAPSRVQLPTLTPVVVLAGLLAAVHG